jgi:tetratricopeptide (TPR) repeat protein
LFCVGFDSRSVQTLKRSAKKGYPWAHQQLGDVYQIGLRVRRSFDEAFGLFAMAAKNGHPGALERIGRYYLYGRSNCTTVDLPKARHYFEAALAVVPGLDNCRDGLLEIAQKYQRVNTDESHAEAKSILLAITKDPPGDPSAFDLSDALYRLGKAHSRDENHDDAYKAFIDSVTCDGATQPAQNFAPSAMLCADKLGLPAQTRFWFGKIQLSEIIDHDLRRHVAVLYFHLGPIFREMRDTCGGCGAEFDGKERKYCRECRTFCYCSRGCQKLHWNRKDDGHREDCLGLKKLKKQLQELEGGIAGGADAAADDAVKLEGRDEELIDNIKGVIEGRAQAN